MTIANTHHDLTIYIIYDFIMDFEIENVMVGQHFKSLSSALLISRYILGLGQRERCCFSAACPNRKMHLEIRNADEGAFKTGT